MIKINPRKIEGPWRKGYALDRHTMRSVYLGMMSLGIPGLKQPVLKLESYYTNLSMGTIRR